MEDFLSIENFTLVFDILYNYCEKNFNITITQQEVKKPMYKIMMKLYESKHKDKTKKEANKILTKTMINIIKKSHTDHLFETSNNVRPYSLDPLTTEHNIPIDYNIPLHDDLKKMIDNTSRNEITDELRIIPKDPKILYKDVLVDPKTKFKKIIDDGTAPKQLREELLLPIPKEYRNIYKHMYNHPLIVTYLTIDSRDANHDLYSENNYKLILPMTYKNVVSVELITAEIPNTEYTINQNNNIIHFQELNSQVSNNSFFQAIVTPGNYTKTQLASELQTSMNNAGSSTYTVSADAFKLETQPFLTSNGTIITSSANTVGGFEGFKAFDGNKATQWKTSSLSATLRYKFDSDKTISKYRIFSSLLTSFPKTWTIEVSDDEITWFNVDTRTNETILQNVFSEFIISNPYTAQYIRIIITDSSNSTDVAISELEFLSDSDDKFTIKSDLSGIDGLFNLLFDGGLKKHGPFGERPIYKENSLGEIMGFNTTDLSNSSSYTSQLVSKLFDEKYIFLYITDFDNVSSINEHDSDKFLPILLDVPKGDIKYYKKGRSNYEDDSTYHTDLYGIKNDSYKKIFNPPQSIGGFRIQFKDYHGNEFNFNGFNNSLILKIELLNIQRNLEM